MQEKSAKIDPDITELIRRTVRESMQPFGLRDVDVRPGEDHDGDPVIFIEAHYDLVDRPIEPDIMAKLALILRDRLWEHGETRFPHIRHRFDERHKVIRSRKAKA